MENKNKWIIIVVTFLIIFSYKILNKLSTNKEEKIELIVQATPTLTPVPIQITPTPALFKPVIEIPKIKECEEVFENSEKELEEISILFNDAPTSSMLYREDYLTSFPIFPGDLVKKEGYTRPLPMFPGDLIRKEDNVKESPLASAPMAPESTKKEEVAYYKKSDLMEIIDFSIKKLMTTMISIVLLVVALMVFKNEKSSDTQKQWASAIIGSIFGFWFK